MDGWIVEIRLILKKLLRNREVREVLELYHDASMDMLTHFDRSTSRDFTSTEKGLVDLTQMVNDKLHTIEKRLGIKLKRFFV